MVLADKGCVARRHQRLTDGIDDTIRNEEHPEARRKSGYEYTYGKHEGTQHQDPLSVEQVRCKPGKRHHKTEDKGECTADKTQLSVIHSACGKVCLYLR